MNPVDELEQLLEEDELSPTARERVREVKAVISSRLPEPSGQEDESIVTGPIYLGAADTVVSDMLGDLGPWEERGVKPPTFGGRDTPDENQPTTGPDAWRHEETQVFRLPDAYSWETFIARGGMGEIHPGAGSPLPPPPRPRRSQR